MPRRIEEMLRILLFSFLKLFINSKTIRAEEINKSSIKRILVVRQHNELGDMLLAAPMIRNLRENFKDSYIAAVARPVNYSAVKYNPDLNEVIMYDSRYFKKHPWKLFGFMRSIAKKKFDLAIVPCTVSYSLTSALIGYFSFAGIKIGCDGTKFGVYKESRNFFNVVIEPDYENEHQVDVNMEFIKPVISGISGRNHIMGVNIGDLEFAGKIFEENGLKAKKPVIAVHPGAGKRQNRWDAKNFAYVADYCIEKFGSKVVLITGPKENDLKNEVLRNMKNKPFILPGMELLKVASFLKLCDLLICNDTGILHVGAGVGISTIAVFGPSNPSFWNPIGENHIAVRGKDGICGNVTVNEVNNTVDNMLKKMQL